MNDNETKFKAILETKGRETGKAHQVWLLAVKYNGKMYFSRRNTNSDWLKNAGLPVYRPRDHRYLMQQQRH